MISFLIIFTLIFTNYQNAECSVDPVPVVFGEIGQNVTIHSRIAQIPKFATRVGWYLQRPGGKVTPVVYFTPHSLKIGRYIEGLPEGSGNLSLTVTNSKISDSGRYFPLMHAGQDFTPGSPSDLAVIDCRRIPLMRIFLTGTGVFLCELRGGGRGWGDPKWEAAYGGRAPGILETEAGSSIDENGVFTRSSILSVSVENGIRNVKCVSRHDTGAVIQLYVHHGNGACQWLLYLSPLCVMLLLTVTGAGFFTRRVMKQTHPAQMRSLNG